MVVVVVVDAAAVVDLEILLFGTVSDSVLASAINSGYFNYLFTFWLQRPKLNRIILCKS